MMLSHNLRIHLKQSSGGLVSTCNYFLTRGSVGTSDFYLLNLAVYEFVLMRELI